MSSVLQAIHRATRPLYEFVYPPLCLACNKLSCEREGGVCHECWETITRVEFNHPLMIRTRQRLCVDGPCLNVVAGFLFEERGVVQQIIHRLKYDGATSAGVVLGAKLGGRLIDSLQSEKCWGIVPVPLHRSKKRERGYNQSDFIAAGIARMTGLPVCPEILRRVRYTLSQTRLSAAERRQNVADAFEVPPRFSSVVEAKRFLLVDDVITTGATTAAAGKALMAAGALSPIACAVALAE